MLKAILAADKNWAIGVDGGLLIHLPSDLKYFKQMTLGKTVIMGDVTLFSLPGSKPLPGRRNIVLSLDKSLKVEGADVLHDIADVEGALAPGEEAMVIGGGTIYKLMLPMCDTVYATRLDAEFKADTWFPDLDASDEWELAETGEPITENGCTFRFCTYKRVK